MVVHVCNQSTQEMKAEVSRIQGHHALQKTNYTWQQPIPILIRTVSRVRDEFIAIAITLVIRMQSITNLRKEETQLSSLFCSSWCTEELRIHFSFSDGHERWLMNVISACGRLRQENCYKFETSKDYRISHWLLKKYLNDVLSLFQNRGVSF